MIEECFRQEAGVWGFSNNHTQSHIYARKNQVPPQLFPSQIDYKQNINILFYEKIMQATLCELNLSEGKLNMQTRKQSSTRQRSLLIE